MSLRDWHSRVEKVWRATEGMCLGWFLGWVRRLLAEGFYGWVSRLSVTGLGALPFFVEDPLEEVGGEEEEVVVGGEWIFQLARTVLQVQRVRQTAGKQVG
jgi:hypothetical protein